MAIDYSLYYSKFHGDSAQYYVEYATFYRHLLGPVLRSLDQSAVILDVGCGIGLLVASLRTAGYSNVSGIDLSPQQIAVAEKRGLPCSVVDEAYLREQALRHPNTLDAVFLMDVLEHIPVSVQIEFIESIRRLLKPDGQLILSVPNANSTFAARWRYNDWTHQSAFTEDSLAFVLQNAGFNAPDFLPYEFGTPPRFPFVHKLSFWTWTIRKLVRGFRRLEAIGELGRQGLTIPLQLNLLAVARRSE